MKFSETDNILTIPNCEKCFIYFLLCKNEVVYVGQTTQGLKRPFTHKDKDFDTIKVLYCNESDLDILEEKYIEKYYPKYNQCCNYKLNYSLQRVKKKIREITCSNTFNIFYLRKLLKQLEISYYIDKFKGTECVSLYDYNKIIEYVKTHSEEFNI